MTNPPLISIVVPVYGSPQSLAPLHERTAAVCAEMDASYELVLIDDRCPRGSWGVIQELAKRDPRVVGVRLSRNFGQHAAINAGLQFARGDWVVVMDCDLQDQPEEIPNLLAKARRGGFEIVRAQRRNRTDPWHRKAASLAFYNVLSFLTDTHQSADVANFGVYSRKVISAVNSWQEESKYFPAIIQWVGFSQTTLPVAHGERYEGASSYSLSRLLRLGANVIVGFSDRPLKLMMLAGFMIAVASFLAAMLVVVLHLLGTFNVRGWASVVLSLWFLSGCMLFGLGLTGLYVGRILIEAKGRPTFIVETELRASAGAIEVDHG